MTIILTRGTKEKKKIWFKSTSTRHSTPMPNAKSGKGKTSRITNTMAM